MTLTESKEFLPGTGRWQAQPDGGGGLGERLEDLERAAGDPSVASRHLPVPGRNWQAHCPTHSKNAILNPLIDFVT
jgi:hypothetical protein